MARRVLMVHIGWAADTACNSLKGMGLPRLQLRNVLLYAPQNMRERCADAPKEGGSSVLHHAIQWPC